MVLLAVFERHMANVIVNCPNCGHSFIKKSPRSGLGGGIFGAIAASALGLTVTIGSAGLAGPLVGGALGAALTHRGSTCSCPECGGDCQIPEK